MNATGWVFRIAVATLILMILGLGAHLGWVRVPNPGFVFYASAAFVGLLVWWHFQDGGAERGPGDQAEENEASLPAHQDSITKG